MSRKQNRFLKNFFDPPHIQTIQTTRHNDITSLIPDLEKADIKTIQMNQIHGSDGHEASKHGASMIQGVDALYTHQRKVALAVKTADCLPILIYHPFPVIACVHAGRKGTNSLIVQKILKKLMGKYELSRDFKFWFGPAICKNCYEIQKSPRETFDLIEENRTQIESVLSQKPNINFSNYCTSCHNSLFYSYRKENKTENRIHSLIYLP
jgi:copper oxidase (laccase) domain-containing protein